jgi:chromosome segregation ATPase
MDQVFFGSASGSRYTGEDLLAHFDTDGDHKIGGEELKHLAEQLQCQVDYCTQVLNQLHVSEQEKLLCQKELHAKQIAVKQYLETIRQLKEDLEVARKKQGMAQKVADTMTQKSQEMRLKMTEVSSQHTKTLESITVSEQRISESRSQVSYMKERLDVTTSALEDEKESHGKTKVALQAKIDMLNHTNAALARQLEDIKSKHGPVTSENNQLKGHLDDLGKTLADCTRRLDDEARAHASTKELAEKHKMLGDEFHDEHIQMQCLLRDCSEQMNGFKRKADTLESRVDELESTVYEKDKEILALKHMLELEMDKEAKGELIVQKCQKEIEALQKLRESEISKSNTQMLTSKEESMVAMSELKEHYKKEIQAAETRAATAIQKRNETDAKYAELQKEFNDMNKLVSDMQSDCERKVKESRLWMEDSQSTFKKLQKESLDAKQERDAAKHELAVAKQDADSAIATAKAEFKMAAEAHAVAMEKIQSFALDLKDEVVRSREEQSDMFKLANMMKLKIGSLKDAYIPPLIEIAPEISKVYDQLIARGDYEKIKAAAAAHEKKSLELNHEEAQSKLLTMDDTVSKLMAENTKLTTVLEQKKTFLSEKESTYVTKIDVLASDNQELEMKVKMLQDLLKEADVMNHTLQAATHSATSEGNEVAMKHSTYIQDSMMKIEELGAEINRLNEDRQDKGSLIATLSEDRNSLASRAEVLERSLDRLQKEKDELQMAIDAHKEKSNVALSAAGMSAEKYHTHLKQNQDILRVMQEQQSELQMQNHHLRSELDNAYALLHPGVN